MSEAQVWETQSQYWDVLKTPTNPGLTPPVSRAPNRVHVPPTMPPTGTAMPDAEIAFNAQLLAHLLAHLPGDGGVPLARQLFIHIH
jgi:hypothetical protein